ncbi:hypothetical protein [Halorientalis litorea]|jgi:hypothetical protein|uniref:hypothetical protein n=1 Tax=Halorientalis litorea TaxID=2931977 RepID=UPI001FF57F5C|nr:hypothetical protein [Halorientalis litorea]
MAEFTLLEVHLDDATFTANAPFTGSDEESPEDATATASDGSGRGRLLALLAALALAGAAAWVLRNRASDDDGA